MKLKVQDKNLFSLLLLAAPLAGFLASVYFMLEDRRLIGILFNVEYMIDGDYFSQSILN